MIYSVSWSHTSLLSGFDPFFNLQMTFSWEEYNGQGTFSSLNTKISDGKLTLNVQQCLVSHCNLRILEDIFGHCTGGPIYFQESLSFLTKR